VAVDCGSTVNPDAVRAQIEGGLILGLGTAMYNEYVTRAADCQACHTAPGGTPFAGVRAFTLPFGVLYSPNITPDQATGISAYSDEEWLRMLQDGVGRGGKHLYPAMPCATYTLMTREDALAIKAYLRSILPPAMQTNMDRLPGLWRRRSRTTCAI